MKSFVIAFFAGTSLIVAFPATAQTGQLPLTSAAGYPPQQVVPSPFRCANFTRNSDGSWSPLHPVTIRTGNTKATLEPGTNLTTGATYGGVDVAAELNRRC